MAGRLRRSLAGLILLLGVPAVVAEEQPLPDPLSLDDALALARADLPAIEMAMAGRDASAAGLAEAESLSGLRLSAVARLRAVRPSYISPDRDSNDSSAGLALRKRLFDFGYAAAREEAARRSGDSSEWRTLQARQRARLDIMRRFFDVILADLQFARDNEAMAGAFIAADRARQRRELKRTSDIEVLRLEADYQNVLQARMDSQALQRAARARLAIAMGRPGELVSNVIPPGEPDTTSALPEFESLLAEVIQRNPGLQALRAEVESARAGVEAARAGHGPVVSGELDAVAHNRSTSSTHPLGAALVLEVPLLTGGARDADVAAARAALRSSRAELVAAEYATRQEVLDLWQRLASLRRKLEGLKVRGDYRELYLDRSRALYELEVKTDLGDAMTQISAIRLAVAEAEFDLTMTQAELAALAGRLIPEENPQ